MEYKPAHRSNYRQGRNRLVDTIVVHTTEASLESAITWFAMDHAPYDNGPTSAHHVLGQNGSCVQCVAEGDTAYHAGNYQMNLRSVGVEVEGHAAYPATWTDLVVNALVELLAGICQRHGINPTRDNIIGHNEVPNPTNPSKKGGIGGNVDPGPHIPWGRIIDALQKRLNTGEVA